MKVYPEDDTAHPPLFYEDRLLDRLHKLYPLRRYNHGEGVMKVYSGSRDAKGNTVVIVIETDGEARQLPLRLDLANHSPTGFEWGYGGSGPAQLALAIIADVINAPEGHRPPEFFDEGKDAECRHRAVKLHQDFKWRFIAPLTKDQWNITERQVREFIAEQAEHEARHEAMADVKDWSQGTPS